MLPYFSINFQELLCMLPYLLLKFLATSDIFSEEKPKPKAIDILIKIIDVNCFIVS